MPDQYTSRVVVTLNAAGGRRYRFTKSGNAGTTETITHYSFTDEGA